MKKYVFLVLVLVFAFFMFACQAPVSDSQVDVHSDHIEEHIDEASFADSRSVRLCHYCKVPMKVVKLIKVIPTPYKRYVSASSCNYCAFNTYHYQYHLVDILEYKCDSCSSTMVGSRFMYKYCDTK